VTQAPDEYHSPGLQVGSGGLTQALADVEPVRPFVVVPPVQDVQADAPVTALYVSTTQAVQLLDPVPDANVPSAQLEQDEAPAAL